MVYTNPIIVGISWQEGSKVSPAVDAGNTVTFQFPKSHSIHSALLSMNRPRLKGKSTRQSKTKRNLGTPYPGVHSEHKFLGSEGSPRKLSSKYRFHSDLHFTAQPWVRCRSSVNSSS